MKLSTVRDLRAYDTRLARFAAKAGALLPVRRRAVALHIRYVPTRWSSGYCTGGQITLMFGHDEADARATILHEMAHAAAWDQGHGHGAAWRRALLGAARAWAVGRRGGCGYVVPRGRSAHAVHAAVREAMRAGMRAERRTRERTRRGKRWRR